jgi:pimeloyl-ACP methyl ester carboxylesterase
MRKLRLSDGRNLAFKEYGSHDGNPLFYFHGGMSNHSDIAFADAFCKKNNIRIIAPDRPGTGDSCRQKNRRLLDWAEDARQLAGHLKLPQVPVLAWSLAGPYGLACAAKYPQIFPRVITIGTTGPITDLHSVNELGLSADRLLLKAPRWLDQSLSFVFAWASYLPKAFLKAQLIKELGDSPDAGVIGKLSPEEVSNYFCNAVKRGGSGIIDDYRAIEGDWGFDLSSIKSEVHILHGAEDLVCPVSIAHKLQESIPQAKLHIIPSSGHFLLRANLGPILSQALAQTL